MTFNQRSNGRDQLRQRSTQRDKGQGDDAFGHAQRLGDQRTISNDIMYHIMERANAGGAVCAAKRGAIYAVPSVEEIDNCMKTVPLLKLD